MIGALFARSCSCPDAGVAVALVGRRAVPACSKCGALYSTEKREPEEIMRAALVDLATKDHARANDGVEAFTRRIQTIAARALREADEA